VTDTVLYSAPIVTWTTYPRDAFRVLVLHCHRHLAQVERTRRAVGM